MGKSPVGGKAGFLTLGLMQPLGVRGLGRGVTLLNSSRHLPASAASVCSGELGRRAQGTDIIGPMHQAPRGQGGQPRSLSRGPCVSRCLFLHDAPRPWRSPRLCRFQVLKAASLMSCSWKVADDAAILLTQIGAHSGRVVPGALATHEWPYEITHPLQLASSLYF